MPDASRLSLYSSGSTRLEIGPAQFEASLRWDRVRSVADSTSDGRVSEVDEKSEGWSTDFGSQVEIGPFAPYARVATGFREPNLDERLFDGYVHGALRVFGNPALEKESSRTWEAGLRFRSSTWFVDQTDVSGA